MNEKQDNWDEAIDDILFAYRTSVQATTKHTPFYLMFGREARIPIQMEISSEENIKQTLEERVEELADLRQSYAKVAENIKDGQEKQKKTLGCKTRCKQEGRITRHEEFSSNSCMEKVSTCQRSARNCPVADIIRHSAT